jgi:hypothetical protein
MGAKEKEDKTNALNFTTSVGLDVSSKSQRRGEERENLSLTMRAASRGEKPEGDNDCC